MNAVTAIQPDFGTDLGPASHSRPSTVQRVEGEDRGMFRKGVVEARRYADTTLYDRMHACAQLSDRQYAAAEKLAELWTNAGLDPNVGARYSELMARGNDGDDGVTARDRYRRLMRTMQPRQCWLLESMLCGQHPGIRWLASLQAALDDLAKKWGID